MGLTRPDGLQAELEQWRALDKLWIRGSVDTEQAARLGYPSSATVPAPNDPPPTLDPGHEQDARRASSESTAIRDLLSGYHLMVVPTLSSRTTVMVKVVTGSGDDLPLTVSDTFMLGLLGPDGERGAVLAVARDRLDPLISRAQDGTVHLMIERP